MQTSISVGYTDILTDFDTDAVYSIIRGYTLLWTRENISFIQIAKSLYASWAVPGVTYSMAVGPF